MRTSRVFDGPGRCQCCAHLPARVTGSAEVRDPRCPCAAFVRLPMMRSLTLPTCVTEGAVPRGEMSQTRRGPAGPRLVDLLALPRGLPPAGIPVEYNLIVRVSSTHILHCFSPVLGYRHTMDAHPTSIFSSAPVFPNPLSESLLWSIDFLHYPGVVSHEHFPVIVL